MRALPPSVGFFADVPIEKSMRMFHLHMAACVLLTHAALQGMLKRKRGVIINVSSVAAFTLTPGNVMYDATKAFLHTFSENLLLEAKDNGIRIQAPCPGFTRTEFHEVGDYSNFDEAFGPALSSPRPGHYDAQGRYPDLKRVVAGG